MTKDTTALQGLLAPTIEALGYELLGCVYIPQGRYAVLRIYIDSEQGITVEDCETVSHQVSAVLDVEDPISSKYTLEVSSPGLDRPLFTLAQFERFLGAKANIRLHVPLNNRRQFKGILQEIRNDEVIVNVEEQEFALALENIAKANLIPDESSFKKAR